MRSDFDLIVHEICDKEIKIYPIADVHFGALEHDTHAWVKFCTKVANEPNSYIILAGDLINNNTRSSVGSPWDDRIRPREQKRMMVEFLKPLRDKILCCVSGNHERRSLKDADDDPTYDIMAKLDLEDIYRQNAAFMKIRLGARTREGSIGYDASFKFAVTHGAGGGMTGAAVNRNERWGNVIDGVDCVVYIHVVDLSKVFEPESAGIGCFCSGRNTRRSCCAGWSGCQFAILGWYRRCGMNVVNFIISKDLLENRIKDGAGLLNPLSYYLVKVGI